MTKSSDELAVLKFANQTDDFPVAFRALTQFDVFTADLDLGHLTVLLEEGQ
jgi:hypothetical protein